MLIIADPINIGQPWCIMGPIRPICAGKYLFVISESAYSCSYVNDQSGISGAMQKEKKNCASGAVYY